MRLRKNTVKWLVFAFCYLLIIWRIIFVPLYDSKGGRNFLRGDEFSEKNTHSALRYFKENGFSGTYWLPVFNYDEIQAGIPKLVYTHYPALPDILAGFYAEILNTTNPQIIRIFPLLLSVGWFLFIFYMLGKMLPDKRAAFLSACIIVLSNYFIAWADNLHKHMYEEALKWIFVFGLFRYFESGRKNTFLLAGLCILYIISANISFEPILFLAVITVGFTWTYTKRILTKETIFLGLAAVVGFGLHLWQNTLHFGTLEIALKDLTNSAVMRTVGDTSSHLNELKRTLHWQDYVLIPFHWLNRIERFFLIPGWAMLYLSYLGLRKLKQENLKLYQIAITILVAGLIWSFAMAQHFLVHNFTTRNVGLFYGFIAGYGIFAYIEVLKNASQYKLKFQQVLHVLFIGYIATMAISQQIWDLYLKYGFLYPFLY